MRWLGGLGGGWLGGCGERGWGVAGDTCQGCGIVEFESAEEAAEAINTLHLSEVCRFPSLTCCM